MAELAGNERAILTCRSGACRSGASRSGFAPSDVKGASNDFYLWTMKRGPVPTLEPGGADATWTTKKS